MSKIRWWELQRKRKAESRVKAWTKRVCVDVIYWNEGIRKNRIAKRKSVLSLLYWIWDFLIKSKWYWPIGLKHVSLEFREVNNWNSNLEILSILLVFEVMALEKIICGVSVNEEEKKAKGRTPEYSSI